MSSDKFSLADLANSIETVVREHEAAALFALRNAEFSESYSQWESARREWSKRREKQEALILITEALRDKENPPDAESVWEDFAASTGPNGERRLNLGWFPADSQHAAKPKFVFPLDSDRQEDAASRKKQGKKALPPLTLPEKYAVLTLIHDTYGIDFDHVDRHFVIRRSVEPVPHPGYLHN